MNSWHSLWATLSPATGEQASIWPYVIAGIGVLALAAFVVLSVLQKKQNTPQDPTPQPPVDNTPTDEPTNDQ